MNPYTETAQEMKRQSEGPKRFAKTAIGVGSAVAGATAFAPILARAAPFLSQYIPEDLAIKGLSKIHPKLGKFVKNSLDSGYDFNEVKDFIGKAVTESQEAVKEDRNIIEQYSPELHQFIKEKVSGGEDPVRAAASAIFDKNKNFEKTIRQIEKEHKTPWSTLVQSIYGGGKSSNRKEESFKKWNEQKKKQSMDDEETERFENYYGAGQPQQQPQSGQGGPGQKALMDILNKINQRLGQ